MPACLQLRCQCCPRGRRWRSSSGGLLGICQARSPATGLQQLGLWLGPPGQGEARERAPARALLLRRWHALATPSLSPCTAHRSDRTATADSNTQLLMPGPFVLISDPLKVPGGRWHYHPYVTEKKTEAQRADLPMGPQQARKLAVLGSEPRST